MKMSKYVHISFSRDLLLLVQQFVNYKLSIKCLMSFFLVYFLICLKNPAFKLSKFYRFCRSVNSQCRSTATLSQKNGGRLV